MPGTQLIHLSAVDIFIIAIYFAMVLFIGFYVRGATKTSKEFFMAGREMTAWIAGLSFVSANLGSLEMMGWAGSTLSIRHPRAARVLGPRPYQPCCFSAW